ncbi:hypothetical protein [Kitasatospora sp. NPDC097643]|uniref:hypothetical protein n=1 Tax=Kitasatospora sp. NPDC097643 TaxID=3157230 RepID=UPI00332EEFD1
MLDEPLQLPGWRDPFTVADQVTWWGATVAAVEQGYDEDVDEYVNELACRDWLHQAWLRLPDHVVQLWTPRILALDTRFRAATTPDDGLFLGRYRRLPHPDRWWWRRRPRFVVDDG